MPWLLSLLFCIAADLSFADDPSCPEAVNPPLGASQTRPITQAVADSWIKSLKDESCLQKLGPSGYVILACMEKYLQTLRAGPDSVSGVDAQAQTCVSQPGMSAEQKAAALGLASAYTKDRLEAELSQIAQKLESGQTLSPEDLALVVKVRERMEELEFAAEQNRRLQEPHIETLKQNGAVLDEKKGWDFSKFNFKKLAAQAGAHSAEYKAIYSVFGATAAEGLGKIYAPLPKNLVGDDRPVTVVLGNTAIIPNIEILGHGNRAIKNPEVMSVEKYKAEVSATFANLINTSKQHLRATAEVRTTTDGLKAVGRALFRHFGAEQRTSAEQKRDKTYSQIEAHERALKYRLGLEPKRVGEISRQLQTVFHESFLNAEEAIKKVDAIDFAVKGTLMAAAIVATAGYAAPALSIASTSTVLTYAGTGVAVTAGIVGGEAIFQAAFSSNNGGGGFWCNLGDKFLEGQVAHLKWAPVTVVASMILPAAGRTIGLLLGAGFLGRQIAGEGGSIDSWKSSNELKRFADNLRQGGYEEAAQSVERQATALRVGAVYRPVATVAVMAAGETMRYRAANSPKRYVDLNGDGKLYYVERLADGEFYVGTTKGFPGDSPTGHVYMGTYTPRQMALLFPGFKPEIFPATTAAPAGTTRSGWREFLADERGSLDLNGVREAPPRVAAPVEAVSVPVEVMAPVTGRGVTTTHDAVANLGAGPSVGGVQVIPDSPAMAGAVMAAVSSAQDKPYVSGIVAPGVEAMPATTSREGAQARAPPELIPIPEGSVGFYSGSFDPPTRGHESIIRRALEKYKLRKLIILVNVDGPKNFKASIDERIGMLRAMLSDVIDKIEIVPVYASEKDSLVRTLEEKEKTSAVRIIGQDSFQKIPLVVLHDETIQWVVVPREDEAGAPLPLERRNIRTLNIDSIAGFSSTRAREALRDGKPADRILSPHVVEYISKHGLYRQLPNELQAVQKEIHAQAFKAFLAEVQKRFSHRAFGDIEVPVFEPQQSRNGWAEQFIQWIVKKKDLKGDEAKKFIEVGRQILKDKIIAIERSTEISDEVSKKKQEGFTEVYSLDKILIFRNPIINKYKLLIPQSSSSSQRDMLQKALEQFIEPEMSVQSPAELLAKSKASLRDMYLFPSEADVYHFERELSRLSGLSLEEVVALTRNFSEDVSESGFRRLQDGSTGLFRAGQSVRVDPSKNIPAAYRKGMARIVPGSITIEDIMQLRRDAIEVLAVGEDGALINPPLKLKDENSVAVIDGPVSDEVITKLKGYGYEVTVKGGKTRIRYAHGPRGPPPLERFTKILNQMIALQYPPELIVAYAVQELLIIHPFKDGNGRTARLLGQILYKKLTGKNIVFPKEFHHEMEFTLKELTEILQSSPAVKPRSGSSWGKLASVSDLIQLVLTEHRLVPEIAEVPPASDKVGDSPFGQFTWKDQKLDYATLPAATKGPALGFLYYGKPAESVEAAETQIERLFQFGRASRGKAHRDAHRHVLGKTHSKDSEGAMQSGFLQTTKSSDIADGFLRRGGKRFRIKFIIDPRGAEVVDLPALMLSGVLPRDAVVAASLATIEGEVSFSTTLNPHRIVGAIIYEKMGDIDDDETYLKPVKFIINPHYTQRGTGSK